MSPARQQKSLPLRKRNRSDEMFLRLESNEENPSQGEESNQTNERPNPKPGGIRSSGLRREKRRGHQHPRDGQKLVGVHRLFRYLHW